jgi:membrane protein DedA with SNARE-associated domain
MISETLWDSTLVCLIGAFFGLVVGQFVEPREAIMKCILIGMMIGMILLTIYYAILAYREWKREQKKNKRMYRGGYSR